MFSFFETYSFNEQVRLANVVSFAIATYNYVINPQANASVFFLECASHALNNLALNDNIPKEVVFCASILNARQATLSTNLFDKAVHSAALICSTKPLLGYKF